MAPLSICAVPQEQELFAALSREEAVEYGVHGCGKGNTKCHTGQSVLAGRTANQR